MLPIEQCYGVVVVLKEGEHKFLILKQVGTKDDNWSFAKGHKEEGESPIATAMRELEEETGITEIEILDFPLIHEEYVITHHGERRLKVNEYFIGFVIDRNVKVQEEEICEYKWATYDEAMNTFCHESRNEVLAAANNFLKSK